MYRFLVVGFAAVALIALPGRASAQADHSEKSHKTQIHVSDPIYIGATLVEPGDYKVECKSIDGQHTIVVTPVDSKKEIVRVPCKTITLDEKIDMSQFRTVTRRDGTRALVDVRFKGETIAHTVSE
jgi:hypothetical protein